MKAFLITRIKNFIKPVYLRCRKVIQELKWYIQYYEAKRKELYPKKLIRLNFDTSKKIIVLVPHADDEWIGTYSLIKQCNSNLHCIYFNLFGNDYSDKNIQIRNLEIRKSSNYWGFTLVNNYNYNVEALLKELNNAKMCFVPSPFDWHEEHRKVFHTFVEAYSMINKEQKDNLEIYCYCVSVPHPNRVRQYYIPLTKNDIDRKWKTFSKIYYSQAFMPAFRYKLQLKMVPKEVGYAAQTFLKMDENTLLHESVLNKDEINIKKISLTKSLINNIFAIRRFIDSEQ